MFIFFYNGGIVEFCISVSFKLGDYYFFIEKLIKFFKMVFFLLVCIGLLKEIKEEIEFGICWSNFLIFKKGINLYNELEVCDENV